ncbi:thioester domain-containing protein [Yinghuangia seranimata]|uniref:thioester domain-containing protein n=1 Tax=Yinghuangia seranimata TaxID=408067 RepID=UPI00248CC455|nr:thioester domain-containing protein [Yinghuangia seranimata]MDI2126776.1 thioester domain-containing protein [Yinghuangia seranimata]
MASSLAVGGAILAAAPAHADSGVKGTYESFADVTGDGNPDDSMPLIVTGSRHKTVRAGLMNLKLDTGETLKVYCVDIDTDTEKGNQYSESPWDNQDDKSTWPKGDNSAQRRAKLKWILLNSFPTVGVDKLKTYADIPDLDAQEAAAATQAALWHFSDNITLNDDGKVDVTKLYKKLVADADTHGMDTSEPPTTLALTPAELGLQLDKAPNGIGPFTVKTSAKGKTIDAAIKNNLPAGAKLVDKNGAAVSKVGDGDDVYVKPAAGDTNGQATVQVSGKSSAEVGRLFTGTQKGKKDEHGNEVAAQKLILAQRSDTQVQATSVAKWGKGPLPAYAAEVQCKQGGVEVTVTNNGDQDFVFTLDNKQSTVAKNGGKITQLVKVNEDQAYTIQIMRDGKVDKEFKGVRDCETASTPTTPPTTPPATPAPPAPKGPELAQTGGDGSGNTALYLSGGAVLLLGGGLVFFVVRRRTAQ